MSDIASPSPLAFETGPCPACKANDSKVILTARDYQLGTPGTYSVSECSSCHFWFQNPRPSPEAMASYYPESYTPHTMDSTLEGSAYRHPGLLYFLKRHLGYRHLEVVTPNYFWRNVPFLDSWYRYNARAYLMPYYVFDGKVLDVGCGNGTRLAGLQLLGWKNLYGIELVPAAARRAEARGFQIHCGRMETLADQYPDHYFDVITCTMVLEHLFDPFLVVRQIAAKLKPGGQFLFSTVFRDSLDYYLYGRYWLNLGLPRHLVWFRRKDIYRLLGDAFVDVEISHQRDGTDFVKSSMFRAQEQHHVIDAILIRLGERRLRYVMPLLAWLGLTSRISVQCRSSG